MVCQATACNTLQKHAPSVVVPPMPTQHPQNTGCHGVMLHTLPVLHRALCLILKVASYRCCNMLSGYAAQLQLVFQAVMVLLQLQ